MDILLAILVLSLIFFFFYTSLLISTIKLHQRFISLLVTYLNSYPDNTEHDSLISDIYSLIDKYY